MEVSQFLTKADENLRAAQLCFDHSCFNASANRAYYSMLQFSIALLIMKGFPPKQKRIEHAWVQSTFTRELISRRKIFPGKFKPYLSDAQNLRNIADYDTILTSKKSAKRQLSKSEEFILALKKEINNA